MSSLHPKIREFLDSLAAEGGKAAELSTPREVRASALSKWRPEFLGNVPKSGSVMQKYFTGPHADLPINIYTPAGEGPFPAIVYFHGGGWVAGTIEMTEAQHQLVGEACGAVVVSVNYQKAPEHKFPIPFDDCYATLEWVRQNSEALNVDRKKIGIAGESSGGNIAAGIALKSRDCNGPKIAFQILIYPVTDHKFDYPSMIDNAKGYALSAEAMKWYWKQYINNADDLENPYCRPMAAKDFSNLPSTYLITADLDPLRDEGFEFSKKLEIAGNTVIYKNYPSLIHGFLLMQGFLPEAQQAVKEIAEVVKRFLKKTE
jgi:acetyl esterase